MCICTFGQVYEIQSSSWRAQSRIWSAFDIKVKIKKKNVTPDTEYWVIKL